MDIIEAMYARHSVRKYIEKPLSAEHKAALLEKIEELNKESGLNIQLVENEPKAFKSFLAHYGSFSGVTNYFTLIGEKSDSLDELCGYYGEKLVLFTQQLGLNTCWVKSTYKKVPDAFKICKGEELACVITVGYGETQGKQHRSKAPEEVAKDYKTAPQWFKNGVDAALLAPTAINQQKFIFALNGNKVTAKTKIGPCWKIDLGIAKLHFELGAGKNNFIWE